MRVLVLGPHQRDHLARQLEALALARAERLQERARETPAPPRALARRGGVVDPFGVAQRALPARVDRIVPARAGAEVRRVEQKHAHLGPLAAHLGAVVADLARKLVADAAAAAAGHYCLTSGSLFEYTRVSLQRNVASTPLAATSSAAGCIQSCAAGRKTDVKPAEECRFVHFSSGTCTSYHFRLDQAALGNVRRGCPASDTVYHPRYKLVVEVGPQMVGGSKRDVEARNAQLLGAALRSSVLLDRNVDTGAYTAVQRGWWGGPTTSALAAAAAAAATAAFLLRPLPCAARPPPPQQL